ncbi:MAG: type II methionyl aminopeptidase [Candidatus Methanomethylicia archaeon]|nr:type II methionyl aminopeptidase [Candidatus Methanomethylicia archaeon]
MSDAVEPYKRAGEAAKAAINKAIEIIKPGISVRDACNHIESKIIEYGCKPAFPCNICINEIAAHYTADENTRTIIPDNCIVKVDVGAHYDGYIADTAITINLSSEFEDLIKAVREAIDNVSNEIDVSVSVVKLSTIIEKTIKSYGFKPIKNLSGHQIDKYKLHTGFLIPNVRDVKNIFNKLIPGFAYAIEPFATIENGSGEVSGVKGGNIFKLVSPRPPKMGAARSLFLTLQRRFSYLPFTRRWLSDFKNAPTYPKSFSQLLEKGYLIEYPYMVENRGKPVAQWEHTFLILEKEVIKIT